MQQGLVEAVRRARSVDGSICVDTYTVKGGTLTTLFHELVGKSESTIRAKNADAGNVSVGDAIGGLLFHLAEDVSDDPSLFVFSHVRELRPSQCVVEVVS